MASQQPRVLVLTALQFLLLVSFLISGCKPAAKNDTSLIKDFSYSGSARNFAVIGGYNPDDRDGVRTDLANWKNLMNRGQLGKFEIVYASDSADFKSLQAAFASIGKVIQPESTVVFAFSGRSNAAKIRLKDGAFTFGEIAQSMADAAFSAKRAGGQRLYVFNDSSPVELKKRQLPGIDRNRYSLLSTAPALRNGALFKQTFEVGAASDDLPKNSATAVYAGRLSYEFIKLLDQYVGSKATKNTNPSLEQFFIDVVRATAKSSFGKATYQVKPPALLNESMFSNQVFAAAKAKPTPPSKPAIVPPPTDQPVTLNLGLNGQNGATSLSKIFKGKAMLIEVSASWCGPCANLAGQIAADATIKRLEDSGQCSHATILPNDSDSNLDDWNNATDNISTDVSYSFEGSSQELEAQFLSKLTGQQVAISFFPTVFAISRDGSVISVGQDQAIDDFKNACK